MYVWWCDMRHTSAPNVKLTPRSFSPHPMVSLSGSDHKRSHNKPWSGTSVGRMMRRICSIDWRSGLSPPWQQKIFSSTESSKISKKSFWDGRRFKTHQWRRRASSWSSLWTSSITWCCIVVCTRRRIWEKVFCFEWQLWGSFRFLHLPVNSIYTRTLVVAAKQEEVLWIFDFVREQQADGLQGLLSAIDVVAQEQIIWFGWKATVLEQSEQIVILPVDITW